MQVNKRKMSSSKVVFYAHVRKRHCHCPAMWCHFVNDFVNGPYHMVASSLHDVTLVGRHSLHFFPWGGGGGGSFFCCLFCWDWQLSGWSFSCCGRQRWYIQCLLGHSTSFHSILHSASEILLTAFCLYLHLGFPLLRFFDHHFCWDRSSRPGSGNGLQSTAEPFQPLARRCSWGFHQQSSSVLRLVSLN